MSVDKKFPVELTKPECRAISVALHLRFQQLKRQRNAESNDAIRAILAEQISAVDALRNFFDVKGS